MARFSTWFGAMLVLFGLIAYFGTGGDSRTALITCLFWNAVWNYGRCSS